MALLHDFYHPVLLMPADFCYNAGYLICQFVLLWKLLGSSLYSDLSKYDEMTLMCGSFYFFILLYTWRAVSNWRLVPFINSCKFTHNLKNQPYINHMLNLDWSFFHVLFFSCFPSIFCIIARKMALTLLSKFAFDLKFFNTYFLQKLILWLFVYYIILFLSWIQCLLNFLWGHIQLFKVIFCFLK